MLAKTIKNQEEKYEVVIFTSSNILAAKYKYETRDLAVIFTSGRQYLYKKVLPYHYQRFIHTHSTGKGLNQHIKPHYTGELVANIDIQEFKNAFNIK